MTQADWSQFFPNLISGLLVALIVALVGVIVTYFRSERFRKWLGNILSGLKSASIWLVKQWRIILILGTVVVLETIVFRVYSDSLVVGLSLVHLAIVFLGFRLWAAQSHPISFSKNSPLAQTRKFAPYSIPTGIANAYYKSRYLDPPLGDITLGGVQFQLQRDSLILDTSQTLHYVTLRDDGSEEITFRLPEPVIKVKSVHFLINSGNSKTIYFSSKIGEIDLLFKEAPPLITNLVLGVNIREWCPGNSGDFVRETSDPLCRVVWTGMNKQGTNAVIDCLEIPIYKNMRENALEKIVFVHKPIQRPPDEMGVHYSVLAFSLEIENKEG